MKKLLGFLCILLLLLGFSFSANAAPYTSADITINGKDRLADLGTSGWDWEEIGNAIGCFSLGWVEFGAYLEPGNWNIGLNAINFNGPLPVAYTNFEIEFSTGPGDGTIFYIPASDTEVNYGLLNIDIPTADTYEFRFTWLNDQWWDGDANVMITSAFFDNTATGPGNSVPEPATILLLGSGLVGLARFRRKKFFKSS